MRIITHIIIIVVVVVVTIIATIIVMRRSGRCSNKQTTKQSWLDNVLQRSSADGHSVDTNQEIVTEKPGFLDRIKSLFQETSKQYKPTERTRGAIIESELRRKATPRRQVDSVDDIDNDDMSSTSSPRRQPTIMRTKKKKGDLRERQHKLVYEGRCRQIMEKLFNKQFAKIRPAWLRNEKRDNRTGTGTNHKLELDGYCEQLGIAFEYNGKQHRVYPNTWHETKKQFDDQQKRDRLKIVRCEEENIKLIVIPDREIVPYDKLYEYITTELERLGVVEIED